MPRLIHLNGPSRVGTTTLARRYVDEHPGTLLVDIDVLVALVGGWREDFFAAFQVARAHGMAMATRHLNAGHDVVVPQLVTSFDKGPGFEAAAHEAGADYLEVVLVVDADEHAQRLRSKRPTNEVEARVQTDLEDRGNDLISRIRQHLSEYLADRPETIRLETTGLTADATYRRLLDVIATDAAQRAH